jgi:hypothetical protein
MEICYRVEGTEVYGGYRASLFAADRYTAVMDFLARHPAFVGRGVLIEIPVTRAGRYGQHVYVRPKSKSTRHVLLKFNSIKDLKKLKTRIIKGQI